MAQNNIEGLEELTRQLENLGKNFPKPKIRRAARAGARITLRAAKSNANALKETGNLKKGLIMVEDEPWKNLKKSKKVVMRIVFDRAMNSIFQKPITPEGKGTRGGKKDTGYYPVSVEYGYKINKDGTKVPGKYFVKKAIENTSDAAQKKMIDSLLETIDKITNS